MEMAWWNFKTEKWEHSCGLPDNITDFIPQDPAAQGLYQCHIKLGKSVAEALCETLKAVTGHTDK